MTAPGADQVLRELNAVSGQAVLKVWFAAQPLERAQEAARSVELARAAGWRTPRWLYTGTTAGGYPYEVQEFVQGEHRAELDHKTLDQLLELNSRQAGLGRRSHRGGAFRSEPLA